MWAGPGTDPEENPPPQEVTDLKDQFEYQQTQIAQLKEMLKKNEQQLVTKEKEVEEYATKLSDIKTRSKASKRSAKGAHSKTEELEAKGQHEGTAKAVEKEEVRKEGGDNKVARKEEKKSGKSNLEKARQGNLILLRKKLEENRMKFEQRGKEMTENKRGIEEMVEQLRSQLEERDQTIQELQRGLEAPPPVPVRPVRPVEIEHMDMNLPVLTEQQQELYAQLAQRDSQLVELQNRILDLQENLKEKDSVIDARTRAITLMSEDMSRKSKTTLDTLDETREQMRLMQHNFVALETSMKVEKEQLNKQLEAKDKRLHQVEENNKKLESVRFDLSTRVAELQAKVVHLQSSNTELQRQSEEAGLDTRVEELTRSLDEANKQLIKNKAQHKSLTKQLNSLKKVSDASEEIVRLQQRLAELEEDKGNLQLHLVDFDELKVSEERWRHQVEELEERVRQQSRDLDSHLHVISLLEAEKLDLVQGIQDERARSTSLETEVEQLRAFLSDLENLKVTSEMKAVVLEEQVDMLSREKMELQAEVATLEGRAFASDDAPDKRVKDSSNLELSLRQLESDLEEARSTIADQREVVADLKMKLESREEDIEMQQEVISKLEQLGKEVGLSEASMEDTHKISEIVKELEEMAGNLEEWKNRCSVVEDRLLRLEEEKVELEKRLKDVTSENSLLSTQLRFQNEVSEDLASKTREQSKLLAEREETIASLQGLIENNRQALAFKEQSVIEVSNKLKWLQEEFDRKREIVGSEVASKDEEMVRITNAYSELEVALKDRDSQLLNLGRVLEDRTAELRVLEEKFKNMETNTESRFREQLECLTQTLAEKDRQLEQQCQDYKNQISVLESDCKGMFENLQVFQTKETDFNNLNSQLESSQNISKALKEELASVKHELNSRNSELSAKEGELEKTVQKTKEQTEKIKKLAAALKAKAVAVKGYEEKDKKFEAVIEEKDNLISEVTVEKERCLSMLEALRVEFADITKAMESLSEKYMMQESNVRSKEDKIEELLKEVSDLTTKISLLEHNTNILKEERKDDARLAEEHRLVLKNQVVELEREIGILQMDLRNKRDQVDLLTEENSRLLMEHERLEKDQKRVIEGQGASEGRNQELIGEILKKEAELNEVSMKVEELATAIEEKDTRLDHLEEMMVKVKELEKLTVGKDMQVTALEEQLAGHTERYQQSWSALEAKLQEREGFIESLEQELVRSRTREQHLEEEVCYMEERRRSLVTKLETLGERLQESDRSKEEAEEIEGVLEQRMSALIASEEVLHRKIQALSDGHTELTQRVAQLEGENAELTKSLACAENGAKGAHREVERLTAFESEYTQALEKIEALEAELKRSSVEFDRCLKEKIEEARQYTDNLELDLKNLNSQQDILEVEKKALMEHCEKLNDIKLNLEEEVEGLMEKNEAYCARISELESNITKKELEFKTLSTEKEKLLSELNQKLTFLENQLQQREEVNVQSVQHLEESVRSHEEMDFEKKVSELSSEVANLRSLLTQKETEVQSYQTRMLQLQFGGSNSQDSSSQMLQHETEQASLNKLAQLEEFNNILEARLDEKDSQLSEISGLLSDTNDELEHLRSELTFSRQKFEEVSMEMSRLQDEVKSRDNQFHEQMEAISQISTKNSLSQQIENIHSEYESRLSILASEKEQLFQELLQEKAKAEVSNIITLAKNHIHEIDSTTVTKGSIVGAVPTRVRFEEVVRSESMEEYGDVAVQEMRDWLNELTAELNTARIERDAAISKANELASTIPELVPQYKFEEERNNAIVAERDVALKRVEELTFRMAPLQEQMSDLRLELESITAERNELLLRVDQLVLQFIPLQELQMQLNELRERLEIVLGERNEALARIEAIGKQSSSMESEYIADNVQTLLMNSPDGQHHPLSHGEEEGYVTIASMQQGENASPEQAHVQTIIDLGASPWDGVVGEEEGWGWGADEARLEEEHLQKQQQQAKETSEPIDKLQQQIFELQGRVQELETEKEKLQEEVRAAQVRSGKMLKKLKDFKLKNESLMRENQDIARKNSSGFGDLDSAIEEELKIRIDTVEKELRECKGERDSVRLEKDGLLKRVDTLTAANERFVEIKERQDMDVEVWQRKNRELLNQIEALQWRIGELEERALPGGESGEERGFAAWHAQEASEKLDEVAEKARLLASVNDLQERCSALAADNEALQGLLEEQRNLRLEAEAAMLEQKTVLNGTNTSEQRDVLEILMSENETLKGTYRTLCIENEDIMDKFDSLHKEAEQLRLSVQNYTNLKALYDALQLEHDKLKEVITELDLKNVDMKNKYESTTNELELRLEECIIGSEAAQSNYHQTLEELRNDKQRIEKQYKMVSKEYSALQSEFQRLVSENQLQNIDFDVLKCKNVVLQEQEDIHIAFTSFVGTLSDKGQVIRSRNSPQTLEKQTSTEGGSALMAFTTTITGEEDEQTTITGEEKEQSADMLEDLQMRIIELSVEVNRKTAELEMLRDMIKSEQLEREEVEVTLKEKVALLEKELENQIQKLLEVKTDENQEIQKDLDHRDQEILTLTSQLADKNVYIVRTETEIQNLKVQVTQKDDEVLEYRRKWEVDTKCQSVPESELQELISAKEQELGRLQIRLLELEQKTNEILGSKDQDVENLRIQIAQREREMDELMYVKDEDIQNLRIQLLEAERRTREVIKIKDEDIHNLQRQLSEKDARIYELSQTLDEEARQLTELRELLEVREHELHDSRELLGSCKVELKHLLARGDRDETAEELRRLEDEEGMASEQSELDLALYMLHHRDVRCDELTLELMQLLEERDTLQLRLSTALRINEELRSKIPAASHTPSPIKIPISSAATVGSSSDVRADILEQVLVPIEPHPLTQSVVEEPREDLCELANKLSQLHTVDYRRDVTLCDEREQRHSEQMQLLQQRGSSVVLDTNFTLSRDVQSPSTVLFNWIRGRSTPKVMHI